MKVIPTLGVMPEGPAAPNPRGKLFPGRTPPTAPLAFLHSWGSQTLGAGVSRAEG